MILDIDKFIAEEKPYWDEMQSFLNRFFEGHGKRMPLDEVKRFYYLYERVSEDLVKISTFSGEQQVRAYLEKLVAQAYSVIHSKQKQRIQFSFLPWLIHTFPETFRRNIKLFYLSLSVMLLGSLFGGFAAVLDTDVAKEVLVPQQFQHVMQSPDERVRKEESADSNKQGQAHTTFAANLMTHNTQVSINTCAFGITWGIGTLVMLFYNGILLGLVVFDFVFAGQTAFVAGWLLPHGSTEISAILLAGQAGLIIGSCLLKPGAVSRMACLKNRRADIITILGGVTILLIWSGIVESFFSQYHAPVLPYWVKITFGTVQLIGLYAYLFLSGKRKKKVVADGTH